MSDTIFELYFADTNSLAVFMEGGPKPQFLLDTPKLKVLVVGLDAGAQLPVHPAEVAMYHFIEGEGSMTVGEQSFPIKPGVTVIVPSGERRGINARTRISFLAAKGEL